MTPPNKRSMLSCYACSKPATSRYENPRVGFVDICDDCRKKETGGDREALGMGRPITVRYKNWRGEVRVREIIPLDVFYGATEWHPWEQWLLKAVDPEDGKEKDFALSDCDFIGVRVQA